jgi:zinc transporter 9
MLSTRFSFQIKKNEFSKKNLKSNHKYKRRSNYLVKDARNIMTSFKNFSKKGESIQPHPSPRGLSRKSQEDSARAVRVALMGNTLNTIIKFAAFMATGSGTILSEVYHSAADTCNQALLLLGIQRSLKPANPDFPYGFGNSRFIFALISAVGFFFLGCGASLYAGISGLFEPNEVHDLGIGLAVVGISCIIESYSFSRGLLAVKSGARETGMEFYEYVLKGPDPMGVSVMLEDGAALVSLTVASIFLGLSYYTGNPIYDAIGSILVGLVLGQIALFLIYKNSSALLGRAVPRQTQNRIITILNNDDTVTSLHNIKAVSHGPDAVGFKVEIEFSGPVIAKKYITEDIITKLKISNSEEEYTQILLEYGASIVEGIGDEVDRLESNIRKEIPEVKYLDLESN